MSFSFIIELRRTSRLQLWNLHLIVGLIIVCGFLVMNKYTFRSVLEKFRKCPLTYVGKNDLDKI